MHGGLALGVLVYQREALAVTTELTDAVYLVHSTGIRTINPWVSKQQPWILPLSFLVKVRAAHVDGDLIPHVCEPLTWLLVAP